MFEWNSFAFISVICFLMSSASATLTLWAKRSGEALLWGLVCVVLSLWTLGLFLCFNAIEPENALFWARHLNYIIIFLPALLFHFCVLFINKAQYYTRLTLVYYALCFAYFVLVFSFPEHFLHSPTLRFETFWFPYAGQLFYIFPVLFSFAIGHSLYLLINFASSANRAQQRKAHYLMVTILVGMVGAGSSLALEFGWAIPPYGIFSVAIVVLIATYAILRHDLLDLPETFSLITARTLIYIIIFAVVVSVIHFGAFFDDIYLSGFQMVIISLLMVLICELYAVMKSRVQFLSDRMLTRRKMQNDKQFKALIRDLENAIDFESMLPLLRAFFERQTYIYHYGWYLDQSLLGQSLKKGTLKEFERQQNLNDNTFQRILFSAKDGRRHDRLPATLRLLESRVQENAVAALLNSEQLDQAYEWVDTVPGRELLALPLMAGTTLRGLTLFVVSQDEIEYADQVMLQSLSAKLAIVIERFDAIRKEAKMQQRFLLEKMNSLQSLAYDVAFEMQLPVTELDHYVTQMFELSRQFQEEQPDLASKLRSDTNLARIAIERNLQLIDIIVKQVQGIDISPQHLQVLSLQPLVSKALAEFVFMAKERHFFRADLVEDLKFEGDEQIMVFVLFSLIKFSLAQAEYPKGFAVQLSTLAKDNKNWLLIRFNHRTSFKTDKRLKVDKDTGLVDLKTGDLGLSYCSRAMSVFSGEMQYHMMNDELSEFRLGFPILKQD